MEPLLKLDSQLDAQIRRQLRDALRARGEDPYAKDDGLAAEDFVLGGQEFREWTFRSEAAMFSRVGLNEGVLAEPLGEEIPGEQTPEIEAQCRARAEILFLRLLLPERFLKKTQLLMIEATYGPFNVAGKLVPATGEQIRRVIWLRILFADGEMPVSDRCKAEFEAIRSRLRPEKSVDLSSPASLLEWQSWLGSFESEHPLLNAFLQRKGR